VVWKGVQLLEVVSISLTQGQDNPQLIFESMNSTGKDLSSADLIRNFVLMGHPKQDELYLNYWRPIEVALGASTYDEEFDDFVSDWLTVRNAPESLVRRDVYQLFKRYYESRGYGVEVPVEELLKELKRFATYYAQIGGKASGDAEVDRLLSRIHRLDISVVDPLLMSVLDDHDNGALSRDDLLAILSTLESYLFRRSVCDCATNSLQKFFSSLIARLAKARDEKRNYLQALQAFLLGEAGTARRFPTDAEFLDKLRTRDAYHFRRSLYLLSRLENSYHPKDERDFSNGQYTIEHIMPQNALAHPEWRDMLGDVDDEEFEHLLHNLGNLTLTAYNSELSDGTFQQKKERVTGGYDNEFISISADLREATEWTPVSIEARGKRLAQRALEVWAFPDLPADVVDSFRPRRKSVATDNEQFRAEYWHGFYELCGESQAFVDAFGDPTGKPQSIRLWKTFSIGLPECHLECRANRRDHYAGVGIYLPTGAGYGDLYARGDEIESEFGEYVNLFQWSDPNDAMKHKALWLRRDFDYDRQDWVEAQTWMRDMLLRLREVALQTFADKG
jgi:hypothetical protein